MGGKKKGGGGKKKKAGGDDDEMNQDVLKDILFAKVETLKSQIYLEQERRDNANATIEELRKEEEDLDNRMESHHGETRIQVTQMTRVYRNMEDGKNREIDDCSNEVSL